MTATTTKKRDEQESDQQKKTKVYAVLTKPENRCGVIAAKKLAERPDTRTVYFAYFRKYKLQRVMRELQASCGEGTFQFLPYESPAQFHEAVRDTKVDGMLVNKHGCNSPQDGRGEQDEQGLLPFAKHKLVDNANLINRFIKSGKLSKGSRVIISGSEAARGIKAMGFPTPILDNSVESFTSYMDGTGFDNKYDANKGYAYHMAISALMVKALARQYSNIYFASVSPGFTPDSLRPSNVAGVPWFIYVLQFAMALAFPIMRIFGAGHGCNVAATRFVDAIVDDSSDWDYPSGTPVGALEGISGPFGDLTLMPNGGILGNEQLQDLALDAVSQYMDEDWYCCQ